MDLAGLYAWCHLPWECGETPFWEGQTVVVGGFLDSDNIFFHTRYPNLPYEKFTVCDGEGQSLEVWPQTPDNKQLYGSIVNRPGDRIIVRGRLRSIKKPVGETCTLGVKMVIDDANQIQFIAD